MTRTLRRFRFPALALHAARVQGAQPRVIYKRNLFCRQLNLDAVRFVSVAHAESNEHAVLRHDPSHRAVFRINLLLQL